MMHFSVLLLLVLSYLGCSSATDLSVQADTVPIKWTPRDPHVYPPPNSTRFCKGLPNPTSISLRWDSKLPDKKTWKAIKKAIKKTTDPRFLPYKWLIKTEKRSSVCLKSKEYKPPVDRRYYWENECPYQVYQIRRFYNTGLNRWCYIPFSCFQQVFFVKCTRKRCCVDPSPPWTMYSICLQSRWVTKYVVGYCPLIRRDGKIDKRGSVLGIYPMKLPQCCKCWSCFDMYITAWQKQVGSRRFTPA